jgi:hypothetical protein
MSSGTPLWPGYALRATGLLFAVAGVLFLLGGLVQINPVWQYGPFANGAQPDWYLGWLIGALRLMPPREIHVFGYTAIPNPFFGGILFPGIVFTALYAWPALERRITKDHARHDRLDRPRDNPWRTATRRSLLQLGGNYLHSRLSRPDPPSTTRVDRDDDRAQRRRRIRRGSHVRAGSAPATPSVTHPLMSGLTRRTPGTQRGMDRHSASRRNPTESTGKDGVPAGDGRRAAGLGA